MYRIKYSLFFIALCGIFILKLMLNTPFAAAEMPEKIKITPELVNKAHQEGSVVFQYSSPMEAVTGYVAEFKKQYPGIEVRLERKGGSKGAYALLQELRANVHRVDVYANSDLGASSELIKEGAFASIVPSNTDDFPSSSIGVAPSIFKNYLYTYKNSYYVVAYNYKFVSKEEAALLKEWRGILDPRFKGKISLVEPIFGVTLNPLFYIMNQSHLGVNFLKELKAQEPTIYVNTSQARDSLVAGQEPISWGAQWEAVMLTLVSKGAPVRYVFPKPTPISGGEYEGILKNAPHPNAARLFWAWLHSYEAGIAHQMPFENKRSILKSVPETRELVLKLLKEGSWYQKPEELWLATIDDWIKNTPKYQKVWRDALDYHP